MKHYISTRLSSAITTVGARRSMRGRPIDLKGTSAALAGSPKVSSCIIRLYLQYIFVLLSR